MFKFKQDVANNKLKQLKQGLTFYCSMPTLLTSGVFFPTFLMSFLMSRK